MEPGQPVSKMARLALRQVMTRIEKGNPTSTQRSSSVDTGKIRPICAVKMRQNIQKSCRVADTLKNWDAAIPSNWSKALQYDEHGLDAQQPSTMAKLKTGFSIFQPRQETMKRKGIFVHDRKTVGRGQIRGRGRDTNRASAGSTGKATNANQFSKTSVRMRVVCSVAFPCVSM